MRSHEIWVLGYRSERIFVESVTVAVPFSGFTAKRLKRTGQYFDDFLFLFLSRTEQNRTITIFSQKKRDFTSMKNGKHFYLLMPCGSRFLKKYWNCPFLVHFDSRSKLKAENGQILVRSARRFS